MARRPVTALTRQRAFAAIKEVGRAALNGEVAISCSELGVRLGLPNETGRGLGAILNEATALCIEHKPPDITAFVVTKESLATQNPLPSLDSFEDGMWPLTGVTIEEVPVVQEQVRTFDWRAVRQLDLRDS